jgi:hypothetical protein
MDDDFLKGIIDRGEPARSDGEQDGLPEPDGEYRAHGRASAQPLYTLHCLLGAEGCRSFQYVHLDSDSSFSVDREGQVIRLVFLGRRSTEVIIRGRGLRMLYDLIHQHRMPWVMELEEGRDFGQDGEKAVITSIDIDEVLEAGQRRQELGPAKVLEIG